MLLYYCDLCLHTVHNAPIHSNIAQMYAHCEYCMTTANQRTAPNMRAKKQQFTPMKTNTENKTYINAKSKQIKKTTTFDFSNIASPGSLNTVASSVQLMMRAFSVGCGSIVPPFKRLKYQKFNHFYEMCHHNAELNSFKIQMFHYSTCFSLTF